MSALGQKQTYAAQQIMSALPPKADMCGALAYVGAQRCALTLSVPSSEIRSGFPYKDCVNRCGIKRVLRFIVTLFVCILAGVSVSVSAETCSESRRPRHEPRADDQSWRILLDRHHAVQADAGAGRPRGGTYLRRRPAAAYTEIILDTLASQCVKATYFLVGQMASAYPSVVRRIYNEGHTIGTHSQHHPHFERLSMRRVEREVDSGISSVTAALGDAKALSPFFRIPYLGRTKAIERFLEGKQLVTWSVDVLHGRLVARQQPESDCSTRHAAAECERPRHHFDARHPSQHGMALPILLRELKANGYNVVHVVAGGERPKSIPELMASGPDGKASPTELTKAPNGNDLTTRQNQRIKKRRVSRRHPGHWRFQADQVTTAKRPFWVFSGY